MPNPHSGPIDTRLSLARPAVLLVLAAGAGGCALHSKPPAPTVMSKTAVTASVEGLRAAVLNRSRVATAELEQAADTIAALTSSPVVRLDALEWKVVAVTDLQSAALARDPAVALGDMILFSLQMQQYLTTGEGGSLFGAHQGIAVAAVDSILADLLALVARAASPEAAQRWKVFLARIAEANPIHAPYLSRIELTDSTMGQLSDNRSALAAVGDIELTARLLDMRIEQIQRTLLKQARWQAQLMAADLVAQPVVDSLLGDMQRLTGSVDQLASSVERIAVVTEGLPAYLTGERVAVLQALAEERAVVLAALAQERAVVLEALHAERVGTLTDAEASAERLIDYTLERRLTLVIDHVLWRLFLGGLLLLLLAFGAGLLLLRIAGWPGASRSTAPAP